MSIHCRAGTLAQPSDLLNIDALLAAYYRPIPDYSDPAYKVSFGTSGHRGSSLRYSYNESQILAIAQAIADVRAKLNINGACFVGKDTHALSEPAFHSVLEVLIANGVTVVIDNESQFTPTPAISHAIICYNNAHPSASADGIVITPSHNPPEDGGIKYNDTRGGPADTQITTLIEKRANELLADNLKSVKRVSLEEVWHSQYLKKIALLSAYVADLENVVDLSLIKSSGLKLAVDPLGGAGIDYWSRIAEYYQLDLTMVNQQVDPTFKFMHLDHDGIIRMDCSSSYVMSGLLDLKDNYDLAFANDPDFDRHGIISQQGLMDSNHYLAVSIDYLIRHRKQWSQNVAIGKTLVSSAMIDRVVAGLNRQLHEFPVGFKWFVDGLFDGTLGFAGEESAGASFLRQNGKVWSTDKDGIILCLLAAEITAKTDKTPQHYYQGLESQYGKFFYNRLQTPATRVEKQRLSQFNIENIDTDTLAGNKITQYLTTAPANNASIGGLKVITEKGWFTARPSGTEEAYKIYCESTESETHLKMLENEAIELVNTVIKQ